MEFSVYYQMANGQYRNYFSHLREFSTSEEYSKEFSHFEMCKGFECSDKGLIEYEQCLIKDANELASWRYFDGFDNPFHYVKEYNKENEVKFFKRNHNTNVVLFFKCFTDFKKIQNDYDPIDKEEEFFISRCYNAGLIYSMKGESQSYGYDYSNFYGSLLSDDNFKFPTKKGKSYSLKSLPEYKYIRTGFYRLKIESSDPNIKKIFSFSAHNVYTNESYKHALWLQQKGYDIKIDLIIDDKPNAYLYRKPDLEKGKNIFGKWFKAILELKQLFPKNKLVKFLSSSLWGHLSMKNTLWVDEDDSHDMNIGMTQSSDYLILETIDNYDTGKTKYKLHDMTKPYKYNLRIKPFLTAYGRWKTSFVSNLAIDSVIRIHTDGICFNKPFVLTDEQRKDPKLASFLPGKTFIPEAKTTGLLTFPIRRLGTRG